MKEVGQGGLQDKIIASIIKQGGASKKTHGSITKGIPDLLIALPNYSLLLAEVKYLGCKSGKQDEYVVPLSGMQQNFIKSFNSRNRNNVVVLAGINLRTGLVLFLARQHLVVNIRYDPSTTWGPRGFDMEGLLQGVMKWT